MSIIKTYIIYLQRTTDICYSGVENLALAPDQVDGLLYKIKKVG